MKKLASRFLILTFIWLLILSILVITKTSANTTGLEITTSANKEIYDEGDEIQVKIKTNKKFMTASFYLNYDSSIISYVGSDTISVSTKDYPNDNLVRTVYADLSGKGTDEIVLKFKVKNNNKQNSLFYLTKTTITMAGEQNTYKQNEISGIDNKLNVKIKTNQEEEPQPTKQPTPQVTNYPKKDNTVSNTSIPKAGEGNLELIICLAVIINLLVMTIIQKKYKKIS